MANDEKYLELLTRKRQIIENIQSLLKQIKTLELDVNTHSVKINDIDHEIGEIRHVNMHCDMINIAHTGGSRVYYCDKSLCTVKQCERGREVSDIHKGYQDVIDLGEDYGAIKGLMHPTVLYFVDGGYERVNKLEIKIKKGCDKEEK